MATFAPTDPRRARLREISALVTPKQIRAAALANLVGTDPTGIPAEAFEAVRLVVELARAADAVEIDEDE